MNSRTFIATLLVLALGVPAVVHAQQPGDSARDKRALRADRRDTRRDRRDLHRDRQDSTTTKPSTP